MEDNIEQLKQIAQLGIELKNIKHAEFASQETNCYSAVVYLDGKKFCHVSNEGHGGCDEQSPIDPHTYDDIKALNALINESIPGEEHSDLKEMNELGELNWSLIGRGAKTHGTWNPDEILYLFEEELRIDHITNIVNFLKYLHETDIKCNNSNYEEVFKKWNDEHGEPWVYRHDLEWACNRLLTDWLIRKDFKRCMRKVCTFNGKEISLWGKLKDSHDRVKKFLKDKHPDLKILNDMAEDEAYALFRQYG